MEKYINSYNTVEQYDLDTKPTSGSSVSRVANSNIIYDGVNVVVDTPGHGDAVFYDADRKVVFIKRDTINLAQLTAAGYTPVGAVVKYYANDTVLIVNKKQLGSLKAAAVFEWDVTGWLLDGVAHDTTITFYSSQVAPTNNPFTYTAADIDTVVTQLNAWFVTYKATSNLQYRCYKKDDSTVHIVLDTYSSWYQYIFNMSGLSVTQTTYSEITADGSAYKLSGIGGEGGVVNIERAKLYFSQDLSAGTYNPTSVQGEDGNSYSVCLPGYLGTSTNVSGDMCAAMRAKWGEGQAGWLNYLQNCQFVQMPAFRGVLGGHFAKDGNWIDQTDGKALTYALSDVTYIDASGSAAYSYPAAHAASTVGYEGVDQMEVGSWFLPSLAQLTYVMEPVTYPAPNSNAATADSLNRTLVAIGGTAISNGSYFWSSCKLNAGNAWYYFGRYGFANNGDFYGTYGVLSCLLYDLKRR